MSTLTLKHNLLWPDLVFRVLTGTIECLESSFVRLAYLVKSMEFMEIK